MKVTHLLLSAVALGALGCPETPPPPPPPNPPQAFLTLKENNVMGEAITGTVNVSGCKTVAQVQILQQDTFLYDVMWDPKKTPNTFTLPASLFVNYYPRLGIAASLTLKAKVVCDDGRTNNSTPVGVKFFPIAKKYAGPGGEQLVPDAFVAEGGVGGAANTFLGCVRTMTGTTIARVDTTGQLLGFVGSMPFDCSLATGITDLSTTSGYRWVFEPNVGAFALCLSSACGNFSVGKVVRSNKAARIGVGKSGTAVIWLNETGTNNKLVKVAPGAADTSNDWEYRFTYAVLLNADPLVDEGAGQAVWISRWEFDMGTKIANIVPYRIDLRTGVLTNGVVPPNNDPAVIVQQQYPLSDVSEPIMPEGFFSPNGDLFTIPLLSYAQDNTVQTTVISCGTGSGLCNGGSSARRWTSPTFPGMLRLVLPYSQSNIYAAIGPYQVWFLAAQTGVILNLGEKAIAPSGSNLVIGVAPGGGTDFYVLTGPDLGANPSFASEIIAVDSPQAGELWRVGFGSGESPNNAMTLAVDANNQPWIRAGTELVKPLSNTEYRNARGPTMP
ncbi:MAG: hypothetical protein U0228_16395 [Myxococcaceae bacterium]